MFFVETINANNDFDIIAQKDFFKRDFWREPSFIAKQSFNDYGMNQVKERFSFS